MPLPSPLPDSPSRWEGWRNYNSDNPYERLCLDFQANPSDEQIEDNCRQLLVWWQKKLPLKNQPSNPVTQLLHHGIDDAPKYLAEARAVLLSAETRNVADNRIRARLKESATGEFSKYLAFALADGVLKRDDETNLLHVGAASGLENDEMFAIIEAELARRGATRFVPPPPVAEPVYAASGGDFSPIANATAPPRLAPGAPSADRRTEFMRLLRLSGLNEDDMTDDQRDALCNMGENLGLTGGQAEDIIDEYLDEVNGIPKLDTPARPAAVAKPSTPAIKKPVAKVIDTLQPEKFSPLSREAERQKNPPFTAPGGAQMLFVPSGTLMIGSTADGAAPNEAPLTKTNISCFFISRFPITNLEYEAFEPAHSAKRAAWANDQHPAVYVSSVDAVRYCEWLSRRDGKKYRLPTEAEWEYAARGTDGRTYPWGERLNRGDLANFADANTTFPWRDPEINVGFAETSPVGSFPRGSSPFGAEDMAGNVWEWCLDYYEPYKGKERTNPRSALNVGRRIYRGGSWKSRASSLRTTTRNFNLPEYSANDVGFRIICECS